ncbi:MAG: phage tail tape measure protein [Succinivibrio sp.]|nr:phage tail tape measure protein [Succinivibrio sp.]
MAEKTYQLGLTLAGTVAPSLTKSFSKADKALSEYDRSVNALRAHQHSLDRVMSQRQATLQAAQAYAKAQQAVRSLSAQMNSSKGASSALKNEYNKAKIASEKAAAAYQKQKAALATLNASTGMAGKSIKQLRLEESNLARQVEKTTRALKLQNTISAVQRKQSGFSGQMASGGAQIASVIGMGMALTKALQPGLELEKAMSSLGATTNLTSEQLAKVQERAILLGRDTILSADQAALGIEKFVRAGYSVEESSKAMDAMANLAMITGKDFAEASDFALKSMKAFNLGANDSARLSDVLAVAMSKSGLSADQLSEKLGAVGPALSQMGLSFEESAAMAVAMDKMGMGAEGLKRTLISLKAPTAAQSKAFHELGLSSLKANGEQKTTMEIMTDLSAILQKLPAEARNAQLTKIFGSKNMVETSKLLDSIANGTLPDLISSMNESGKAAEMAGKKIDNLDGDFKGLGSAISYSAIRAFEALQPTMRSVVQTVSSGVTWVGNFAQEHQTLVKWLGIGATSLGVILAALGSFNLIVGGAGYIVMTFIGTILKLYKVFTMVRTAMIAFNAVLLANPIAWVIAGIAALIAIGVLLYKNWDTIKAYLISLWKTFEEKFPAIAGIVTSAVKKVIAVWENLKYVFSNIIDFVKNIFSGEWGAAWENAVNIFGTVFAGIKDVAKAPVNGVISLINKAVGALNALSFSVPDWVPGIGGKNFSLNIPEVPALAQGGIATSPTLALVGEGRENEAILPLSKLESLVGGNSEGAGAVNITFAPVINISGGNGDPYADVMKALNEGSQSLKRELERLFSDRARLNYS